MRRVSWLTKFLTRKSPLGEPTGEKAVELRQGTAEFEEFVARGELETGNLAHGAGHLASLLHFDPANRQCMALFDQYFDKARGELEEHLPRGDKLYAATEAMRALIWHRKGRLADAVELMLELSPHTHPKYLHAWVLAWVEPDGAIESLSEATALRLLSLALTSMPEMQAATVAEARQARRWSAVSERVPPQDREDGPAVLVRAGILRKAGRFEDALRSLDSPFDAAPDWNRAVARGLILRQKGDLRAASAAFETAQRADPDNMATYLEGGDTFFDADRWEEARVWYQRALAREPAQDWAGPSALYCEWKLTGKQQALDKVLELARSGNGRAHHILSLASDRPFVPEDASANLLRLNLTDIAQGKLQDGATSISLSALEAPSNWLAFALALAAAGIDRPVQVASKVLPGPDPRQPVDAVRYRLWEYQGTTARPGLPPPSEHVRQAIAELARDSFNRQLSFARASRVAEHLGMQALPDILAVMVHPPALPAGRDALEYIPRIQLEAMHVAAQIDDGWEGSERRAALMSALFGPMDWTTNAAIDVLAFLAERQPAIAYDVHKSFQHLERNCPSAGCCWRAHLFRRWQSLPLLYDREREELQAKLRSEQAEQTVH
jgi:tetratricopeptide (TPR) repeat protein